MLGIEYADQVERLSKEAYVVIENPLNGKSVLCLGKIISNHPITTISTKVAEEICLEVVSKSDLGVDLNGPVRIHFDGRYCDSSVRVANNNDDGTVSIGFTTICML